MQWKLRSGSWNRSTDVSEESVDGLEYTIFNLTDEAVYGVRVIAVNAQGGGSPSAAISATVGVPGMAQNLVATSRNEQLNLIWDAPSDPGGGYLEYDQRFSSFTSNYDNGDTLFLYTVEWRRSGSTQVIGSVNVLNPRYNIRYGLENNRQYIVQIRASFVNRIDLDNRIVYINGYGPVAELRATPNTASASQSDHNNLKTFIEQDVSNRESSYPWLRIAWNHIKDETTEVADLEALVLGQVAYGCSSVTGQSLPFECEPGTMEIDIDHTGDSDVIIHELAHIYTLQTTLVSDLGPLGMAHLYFAEVYEGDESLCATEVFADTLLHVTKPDVDLVYFDYEGCVGDLDEPTQADEAVVASMLAGNDPSWFATFFDKDNDGDADPAEVWKALMDIESSTDRRIVFAVLANELGGYCSVDDALEVLTGQSGVVGDYNPWKQDNTC